MIIGSLWFMVIKNLNQYKYIFQFKINKSNRVTNKFKILGNIKYNIKYQKLKIWCFLVNIYFSKKVRYHPIGPRGAIQTKLYINYFFLALIISLGFFEYIYK